MGRRRTVDFSQLVTTMVKMMTTRKMSHRALVMEQEHPVRRVLRQKQSPPDHLLETAGTQWLARAFFWRQKKPETVSHSQLQATG